MAIGKYRHLVTIQKRNAAQSDSGEITYNWEDWTTVWAEIAPSRGSQYFAAQQVQAEQSIIVRTRYMQGVRTDQRIKVSSEGSEQYYNIMAVIDPLVRHIELELMCSMIESDSFKSPKDAS